MLFVLYEVQGGELRAGKTDCACFGVAGLQEGFVDRRTVVLVQDGLLLRVQLREGCHDAEILRPLVGGAQHLGSTEKADIVGLLQAAHQLVYVIDRRNHSLGSVVGRDDDIESTVGLGDEAGLSCAVKVVAQKLDVKILKGRGHVACGERGQALDFSLMYPVSDGHFLKIYANIIKF